MLMPQMAEIEKEEVEFPVFLLWQKEFNIGWQHLISHFIIFIVQLYKKIVKYCGYVWLLGLPLPSTEQIF